MEVLKLRIQRLFVTQAPPLKIFIQHQKIIKNNDSSFKLLKKWKVSNYKRKIWSNVVIWDSIDVSVRIRSCYNHGCFSNSHSKLSESPNLNFYAQDQCSRAGSVRFPRAPEHVKFFAISLTFYTEFKGHI